MSNKRNEILDDGRKLMLTKDKAIMCAEDVVIMDRDVYEKESENETNTIYIKGYLCDGVDDIRVKCIKHGHDTHVDLTEEIIDQFINILNIPTGPSKYEGDEYGVWNSIHTPKVNFRAYFSETESTLDECINQQILMSMGELDIYSEWYGYSEWTIEGFEVLNFKLVGEYGGEHDLNQIFRSYIGKYVHILIDVYK